MASSSGQILSLWVFWWRGQLPGSQQQRQAVVAELLIEALGAGGGGIDQAGVGGAPLPRDQPGTPRQQRLKLCRHTQEVMITNLQHLQMIPHSFFSMSDLCSTWGRSASGPPRP